MDLEEIKRNYERFDDDKLIKLATSEIDSLRPEVIPILNAEIQKRNLSLDQKKSYSQEQFNNPFAKEKLFFAIEYLDHFKSTNKLKPDSIKVQSFYINTVLKVLVLLNLTIILVLLIKFRFGWVIQLILSSILIIAVIRMVQEKLNLGIVAKIKKDSVILYQHPILNFNVIRILVLFQVGLNGLKKIDIAYKDISKLYQKNKLSNKGYYVETFDRVSHQKVEKRIYLEGLKKEDLKELLEIIACKCIESNNGNAKA